MRDKSAAAARTGIHITASRGKSLVSGTLAKGWVQDWGRHALAKQRGGGGGQGTQRQRQTWGGQGAQRQRQTWAKGWVQDWGRHALAKQRGGGGGQGTQRQRQTWAKRGPRVGCRIGAGTRVQAKVDTQGVQAAIGTQAYSCCGLCVPWRAPEMSGPTCESKWWVL